MHGKIIATLFTITMVASAKMTAKEVESQACGNTGKLSCCNTSDQATAPGGLLGAAGLDNLAGGSCEQIPVNGKYINDE